MEWVSFSASPEDHALIGISEIRAQFPALSKGFIFLENAGGAQVPRGVIEAVSQYFEDSYVQLGATYPASLRATEVVNRAHEFANLFMNGTAVGQVVIGPSTTQLVTMLAECYSRRLAPGDEVVISEAAHEANAGPWEKLRRFGIVIRVWKVHPETGEMPIEGLAALLNSRTKIVAFPHVSNLLGGVVDVKAITDLVHAHGAKVVVDGVAFASHRAIDVDAWGVDWYVYSTYKVFGPHMAVLFGRHDAFQELSGPNHSFLPEGTAYKFELGGANHEGCAGLLALGDYLQFVAGKDGPLSRDHIEAAWSVMRAMEDPLTVQLLSYLGSHPRVRVVGPTQGDRVGTVSFLHERLKPSEIVAQTDAAGIGIRGGNMYAYRLCQAMGIPPDTGVTRISLVHYNTASEINQVISVLDRFL